MLEVRSKDLQRYYDNKDKYNERAKKYFRSVWYVENREQLLVKQKEYRDKKKPKVEPISKIINRSLTVSFD